MRKTLSQLIEESIAINNNLNFDDFITESLDVFEEAINSFKDLPNSWKKSQTGSWQLNGSEVKAGENSKVVVLAQKGTVKDSDSVGKLFRKYLQSKDVAAIWLEINDKPIVFAEKAHYSGTDVSLRFSDGNLATINKMVGRDRKTRMPNYRDVPAMKLTEATQKVAFIVQDIARDIIDPDRTMSWEEYGKKVKEFYSSGNFQITIKGLTADKNREEISAQRKENMPLGKYSHLPADALVKIDAARKVVENKVGLKIENIKKEFNKLLNQVFETDKKIDFQKIQTELSSIQEVIYRLNSYTSTLQKYNQANWEKERLAKTIAEFQKITD